MILDSRNNSFDFRFPKTFIPEAIAKKYEPYLNRIPGNLFENAIDFVNYGIQGINLPGITFDPVSQADNDGNQKQIVFQSGDLEFFLFVVVYIDIDIEIKKLNKKIDNLEKTLSVSKSRLENEKFVQNAKEELIQKEKQNILDVENEIKLLKETRDQFSV